MALTMIPMTSFAAGGAVASAQKLSVDGKIISCEKYNIGGSNYFKLRDLAYVLDGTGSQFDVGYDSARKMITVTTGQRYSSPNGTELVTGKDNSASARISSQTLMIDGRVRGDLTVYNIGGSNFFKLRELGEALGFAVNYYKDNNTAYVASYDESAFGCMVKEAVDNGKVVSGEGLFLYEYYTTNGANNDYSYSIAYDEEYRVIQLLTQAMTSSGEYIIVSMDLYDGNYDVPTDLSHNLYGDVQYYRGELKRSDIGNLVAGTTPLTLTSYSGDQYDRADFEELYSEYIRLNLLGIRAQVLKNYGHTLAELGFTNSGM